jgi:hypothetical protein
MSRIKRNVVALPDSAYLIAAFARNVRIRIENLDRLYCTCYTQQRDLERRDGITGRCLQCRNKKKPDSS